MPKFHIEGPLRIEMSINRIYEAEDIHKVAMNFDQIIKTLVGDPNAYVDLRNVRIREIIYVNDKGKE
jgi:hypothetical protein